jgi:hypothetical protein
VALGGFGDELMVGPNRVSKEPTFMKRFTMYRRGDLSATHNANQANKPDEPQFEGVVFSDGRVAVRWLTAKRSVSVWDSLDDMLAIHGHPEYQSELVWHDRSGNETSEGRNDS